MPISLGIEIICLSLKVNGLVLFGTGTINEQNMILRIFRRPYPENGITAPTLVVHSDGNGVWIGARCGILLPVELTLAHIGSRPGSKDGFDALTQVYLERCSAFARCQSLAFRTEEALAEWLDRKQGRTQAVVVLLDSRGRSMNSEAFAAWLGARRDDGTQHIVFAIGPASGWSETIRPRANLLLSLGTMTLAHALARLVVAEQIYRAFTILSGHPYHGGH
jgi:23S rRNA (pseudouridine1915-N3)-methyltransferase